MSGSRTRTGAASVRPQSRVRRALLATASTGLALLAAELAYRALFAGDKGPTSNPRYVVHDDLLGWRYRPGVEVRHVTDEFDVAVRIDEDGRRSSGERTAAPERPLIVCVGDSLTFGWGVEEPECFAGLLRTRLSASVVNLAVSGYGTDQQYLVLQEQGLPLRPDLVVLTLCANDAEEVCRTLVYGKSKPRFHLRDGELVLSNVPVPFGWLERHSLLFRAVRREIVERFRPALTDPERAAGRRLVAALLDRMAAECRSVGAELLVVHWSDAEVTSMLGSGVHVLDVDAALARATGQGPVTFDADPHWNRRGHAAVAEAIAAFVTERALLRR